MTNENQTPFQTFVEGLGIYIKFFPTFFKYMSFPLFGQFFGIILALALPIGYMAYQPALLSLNPEHQQPIYSLSSVIILTIPGLIIFTKAFWGYLIAYVSIPSMAENTIKSGRIYDIDAHKKVAQNRSAEYILLWCLFGLFTLIAIFPPMWVFAAIIFVYLVLIFQVFTFETKLTPFECFLRSKDLIRGNFWSTLILLIFVGLFSYVLLPKIVEIICSLFQIIAIFAMFLEPLVTTILPIENWNSIIETLSIAYTFSPLLIAKTIVSGVISSFVIGYTLPLRSICWTLWYKQLSIKEIKEKSKKKKAKSKENV